MELIILWLVLGLVAGISWQLYAIKYNSYSGTFKKHLLLTILTTLAGVFTIIGFVACVVQDSDLGD